MDNTVSKIPDVWFDIYVRLIPGSLFIGCLAFMFGLFPAPENLSSALWIVLLGYSFGHLFQPISSLLGKRVEVLIGQDLERKKIRPVFKSDDREILIISKQHAETCSMVSNATFVVAISLIQKYGLPISLHGSNENSLHVKNEISYQFLFFLLAIFVAMAFERAFSSKARCKQLQLKPEYINHIKNESLL